jgi:hypothetical protein
MEVSMLEAYRTQLRTVIVATAVAVIPSAVAVAVAHGGNVDSELSKALYVGAVTLTFGGLLGGVLKILLDDVVTTRRKREDAATFVSNVLSDLKAVYDRVGRARILIPAHQSAKTYGSEMRDLIEARVQLRNVVRALERRADGILDAQRLIVITGVKKMEEYLEGLTSEFRDKYKPVADSQRAYAGKVDAAVKKLADSGSSESALAIRNTPWECLTSGGFPRLTDLIGQGTNYAKEFEDPLDATSKVLRNELARILGGRAMQIRAAS